LIFLFPGSLSDLDNGYAGYCTDVCCDQKTQETCYDYDGGNSNYCAEIADGGCPCPEGTVKCGQGKIILLLVANVCDKLHFTKI
jgi:hypothetical protein